MKADRGIVMSVWSRTCIGAAIALSLAGCVNAAMMGGMGVGMLFMTGREIRKASRECTEAIALTRAHLQRLDAAGGDSLPALIPVHREYVATLVSRCDAGTSGKHQPADTTWRPIAAALRQDLVRLPQVEAGDLAAFMVEHRARIERFMALRETRKSGIGTVHPTSVDEVLTSSSDLVPA